MPREEGVPLLIDQARRNRNLVVRREAIFWLGQSEDKRALDFIASILEH
jgi:HEAT repeat protein